MRQLQEYVKSYKPVPKQTYCHVQKAEVHERYRRMLGKNVALLYREKRTEPRLVEVYDVYPHIVVFRYKAFYSTGQFRCYLFVSESLNAFICKDVRVVAIDE
jgi:hypothetical protein